MIALRERHDGPSRALCIGGNIAYVAAMSITQALQNFNAITTQLDNGLTVVVREDHSAPVVAIVTYVNAGYFDEPDHWVGISHVLEHMYFKGTPSRAPGMIAQETKAAGGYLNASTIYDHTLYYTVIPSAAFGEGLHIQSDALINSVIDESELTKELEVIIQEAKRKLDNPAAVARETVYELLFDHHRIRRWRIGTEAGLRKLTRQDVLDFFVGYYRAPAIVVVIAGDVTYDEALRAVRERYATLRNGGVPRDRGPREAERVGFRYRELSGDVKQSRIEIGWRTQPTLHPDTPALDVFAVILGQGRASRLYREVRDTGLVTGASAHNYTPTELGIFGVSAEADAGETRAALRALLETLEKTIDGITAEDVSRAQSIIEARMLRGLETMEGQANFIAEWQSMGDWQLGLQYLEQVSSLTPAHISTTAARYLQLDRAAVVVYRPQNAEAIAANADELRHFVEAS